MNVSSRPRRGNQPFALFGVLALFAALVLTAAAPRTPLSSTQSAPLTVISGNWSWPSGQGLDSNVNAIVKDGSNIYAAGNFQDAGADTDADNIALWNGASWSWPSVTNTGSGTILALKPDGSGNLYVGGAFALAGGDPDCTRICLWNESTDTWSWPADRGLDAPVYAFLPDGSGNVYVGGAFTNGGDGAGGDDDDCDYICLWDETGDSWSWPAGKGLNNIVYAFEPDGSGNLYVSGSFTDGGDGGGGNDDDCDYVCLWNGSDWSWPSGTGLSTSVYALALDGTSLYAGGSFLNGGGDADCDYICLWNESTDSWSWPSSMGLSSFVDALALDGTDLYAGGNFINAGVDSDADYIAHWDGAAWDWPAGAGLNSSGESLLLDGNQMYVGGFFTDGGDGAGGNDDDCDNICLFTLTMPLFADGFESGDFSAWSSVNIGSGNLTVEMGCAMEGTYGMCALSSNNKRKQVIDSVPNDEIRYYASFQLDHNNVTISGAANRIRIFQGRMDTHFPFILLLRYSGGNRQVMLRLQTDAGPGNYVDSAWYTISDATHIIGVDWKQSSGPGNNDGWGDLYVDDTLQGSGHTVDLVDNDTLAIRGIRLGITTRMDGITMTGTLYFDDFYSDNDGYPE